MQVISGPDIKDIKQLPNGDCLFIDDHIGHDPTKSEMDYLVGLLQSTNNPHIAIEYPYSEELEFANLIHIPAYWIKVAHELNSRIPNTNWTEKTSAFSFVINKPRLNRTQMLELLESLDLHTNTYTLVSDNFKHPSKYFSGKHTVKLEQSVRNGQFDNHSVYEHWLRRNVFEPSYIHLINQASWFARSTFIDEKSVFPFEAGNIPIWVGGYRHPSFFRELGFDVFDDIVDHSYETLNDPHDRLEQAILRNKNLLQNKDLLAKYFDENRHRFEANRELIRSTMPFDYYANKINNLAWPAEYKQNLLDFI